MLPTLQEEVMKKILIAGAVVFAAMTTVALAGAPAEPAAALGCAGAAKCQGRALLVPTVVEAKACSGALVKWTYTPAMWNIS